jgi:ubiquinone/menaquinone biosynthesis C-methylase UbiE
MHDAGPRDPRGALRHLLFEALYDRLAAHYDRISRLAFAGEWDRWRMVAVRFIDRGPVVEIGCGTGQTLAALRRLPWPAVGLDPAAPMLRQARRRAAGRLIRAHGQRLPLRTASVGTLLSIFPTAYILDPAVWREVGRVLAPGGRFILIDGAWLSPRDPARWVLSKGHRLVYGPAPAEPWRPASWPLPTLALVERTEHGFVSVYIATQPRRDA